MDDNLFDPDRSISREEMAVIFSRYMDYKDIDPDYIYVAIDLDVYKRQGRNGPLHRIH